MAHFAKIDSQTNLVLDVNVVNNDDIQNLSFPESEPIGVAYLQPWNTVGTYWKQTSYNSNFRKNYGSIGYTYDSTLDAFIPPKPFSSWLLNVDTCNWEPPIPFPNDGKMYSWDDEKQIWILIE